MHTFPCLQRSGDDEKTLLILFGSLLFLYEPFTTIYPFLPPLLGFAIWKIFTGKEFSQKLIWFGYLYWFQIDHDIGIIAIVVLIVMALFVIHRLSGFLICYSCLKFFASLLIYALLIAILLGFGSLTHEYSKISWELLAIYLVEDTILTVLYAR